MSMRTGEKIFGWFSLRSSIGGISAPIKLSIFRPCYITSLAIIEGCVIHS